MDYRGFLNSDLNALKNQGYYSILNIQYNPHIYRLLENESYFLGLLVNKEKVRYNSSKVLYSNDCDAVFHILNVSKTSRYKIYRDSNFDRLTPEIMNHSSQPKLYKQGAFSTASTIYVKKFIDILDLPEKASFTSLVVMKKKNINDFVWEYIIDKNSIIPNKLILTNRDSARLIVMSKILGNSGNTLFKSSLINLTKHRVHSVRWEAVKNLIKLDYDEGISVLKHMKCNDPHPEINEAAQTSLSFL
ncbi:hypothetical protein [Flagellimonas sp. 2504JD4-2]